MTDKLDDYLDDDEELDSSEDSSDDGDAAPEKGKDSESASDSKRIRDLQSKADKAIAEANKLKKQLEEVSAKKSAKVNDGPEVPAEVREWLGIAKERAQRTLYEEDARFKEYGVPPEFITGETPDTMKATAEAFRKLLTEVEGKVRNQVLVEHGFAPAPATTERSEPKNWQTMTREEFIKEREKAIGNRW